MNTLIDLGGGFASALEPVSLAFALLGVLLGTVVGVLPGIGPISAIAILIPVSFGMEPVHGLILLCGIYYGSMYGGSITATLIKTPGEVASAVTAIEGYEMARQGRGKAALATAAIGSFLAGTLAIIGLTFLSPVLVQLASVFGATEYFLLMATALLLASTMSAGSRTKALISIFIGLAVGLVGLDFQTGLPRQTFGIDLLSDGIDFTIFAMALFAIPEAIRNLALGRGAKETIQSFGEDKWMTKQDWQRSAGPWARGSVLGFIIGVLPGVGPSLASFMSYIMEKRVSKRKDEFGHGAIEGVAGPEAANNAGVGGAMIPLFSLGIPGSATTALLLFVFTMYGLQPGPLIFREETGLIWTIIASMYIGNVALIILNLPLVGVFVKLLKMPKEILFSAILVLVVIGAYAIEFSLFGLMMLGIFGVIGYLMEKGGIPLAPAILALVLVPLLEDNFRRMLQISGGSFAPLVTRPVSLSIIILMVLGIVGPVVFRWWVSRRKLLADVTVS
ncbi:tripartite tricarboxylate transporter permease [Brevibacterium sp. FAM 25378]|uniref:tripartite tricarboxylate transporter permease n=1 Tax=unclassified Brevibacterium TaxID=2614124 RepID=UPI001091BD5C|nr:tripartite tricarboxylate transporter permease [Brevibacterium sp. S22]TGD31444.1 tripartite tricarboxylate transporter permease [Brevibacterium sp. S22]